MADDQTPTSSPPAPPVPAGFPTFSALYAATHGGRCPFPWQRRLSGEVAAGRWPGEIGIPTGLGKTACLDMAVWALAAQLAGGGERTAPTRTWYVVNRRLLVDAAHRHALDLCRWLECPASLRDEWQEHDLRPAGPGGATGGCPDDCPCRSPVEEHVGTLRRVAEALRAAGNPGTDEGPLHVTRLRGGADLGARPPEPSQPALIFATVPMFASRWLLRGYGTSARMRPVDAALAGIDSLVLLDEAHLARPLVDLAGPLAACDPGDPGQVLDGPRSRSRFVALTATGDGDDNGGAPGDGQGSGAEHPPPFVLDADDRAHPVVARRLAAAKRVITATSTRRSLPGELAAATRRALDAAPGPTSCLVFANSPATAREVHGKLMDMTGASGGALDADVLLLTGQMRDREAEVARGRLLDAGTGIPSDRGRSQPRARHLVVVATQTLEVGADVDADHLVTETTGARSLIQRLGRVNRLGEATGATVTVVHPTDVKEWPIYGTEPVAVWDTLEAAVDDAEEAGLSLPPEAARALLRSPEGEPSADEPPATAEVLPDHLWEWAKTSEPGRPSSPLEEFYEEPDDLRTVAVLWRAYLPHAHTGNRAPRGGELVPPVQREEAVDVPVGALRSALTARPGDTGDGGTGASGVTLGTAVAVRRVDDDGRTVEVVEPGQVAPGDRVVMPATWDRYDEHGWNPHPAGPPGDRRAVLDLSPLRAGLVLHEDVVARLLRWPGDGSGEPGESDGAGDVPADLRDALQTLREAYAKVRVARGTADEDPDPAAAFDRSVRAAEQADGAERTDDQETAEVVIAEDDEIDEAELQDLRDRAREALAVLEDRLAEAEPPAGLGSTDDDPDRPRWDDWRGRLSDAVPQARDRLDNTPDAAGLLDGGTRQDTARRPGSLVWLDDGLPYLAAAPEPGGREATRVRSDVSDDLSFIDGAAGGQQLGEHLNEVGDLAGRIAAALGLPGDLIGAVVEAARAHDLGKHDLRFQRWLAPSWSPDASPLAKSAGGSRPRAVQERSRTAAGWPRGGRHELLSARLLLEGLPRDEPLRDLVVHLAIAHHGYGRPQIWPVGDTWHGRVSAEVRGRKVTVPGNLESMDRDQPARFRRLCERYGVWGLALLEAVVRQADHLSSARAEGVGSDRGAGGDIAAVEVA